MAEQPTTPGPTTIQVTIPRSMRSKGLERRCSVCRHPKLQEINRDLSTGCSNRIAANKYGLTISAIQRHATGHLPAALQAGMHAQVARGNNSLAEYALSASDKRMQIMQRQMERLEKLITERGAEMASETPGGSTGLLVRKRKTIVNEIDGVRNTEQVNEYEMDANIFKATKDLCELASKESGHWAKVMGLGAAAGGIGNATLVVVMPGDMTQLDLSEVHRGVSLAARSEARPFTPHPLASAALTDIEVETEDVEANARQQALSGQDELDFELTEEDDDVAP